MDTNDKKFYSFFCFDKQSRFGSLKGRVISLKSSTHNKDGQEFKRLNFALACSNIDKKVKYILEVEPLASQKNPETIFVDCVAFGVTANRLEKFLSPNDEIFATGQLSSFEGKNGNRLNLRIQDAVLWKKYGKIHSDYSDSRIDLNKNSDYKELYDSNDIDDEIPF